MLNMLGIFRAAYDLLAWTKASEVCLGSMQRRKPYDSQRVGCVREPEGERKRRMCGRYERVGVLKIFAFSFVSTGVRRERGYR